MAKLYTIGYGRTTWHDFFQRLLDADISCVVDIRRECSKSRNGKAFWWGCSPYGDLYMGDRLFEAGIGYFMIPDLSKDASESMTSFRQRLDKFPIVRGLARIDSIFRHFDTGICLLCCERDYRQCHRRIVAEVVADQLELEVVLL